MRHWWLFKRIWWYKRSLWIFGTHEWSSCMRHSTSIQQHEQEFKEIWSAQFVDYADKFLHNDWRNHLIAAVTKRVSAFNDKTPTNNISENVNKMVKEFTEWSELPVDGIVLSMYLMQQWMLHEFNRGCKHLGNHSPKPRYKNARELVLANVEFFHWRALWHMLRKLLWNVRNLP